MCCAQADTICVVCPSTVASVDDAPVPLAGHEVLVGMDPAQRHQVGPIFIDETREICVCRIHAEHWCEGAGCGIGTTTTAQKRCGLSTTIHPSYLICSTSPEFLGFTLRVRVSHRSVGSGCWPHASTASTTASPPLPLATPVDEVAT